MKKFKEKCVDAEVTKLMEELVDRDLKAISIPSDVIRQIKILNDLREEIKPEQMDKYFVPNLLQTQVKIINAKYLIHRHLSLMKGAQSYSYIYRKFKTAGDWNKTKERLGVGKSKQPTINEIESAIENDLINIRKTEVAYQVAGDKLEGLLDWADRMVMIIQNKLRDADTIRKTTSFGQGVVPDNN